LWIIGFKLKLKLQLLKSIYTTHRDLKPVKNVLKEFSKINDFSFKLLKGQLKLLENLQKKKPRFLRKNEQKFNELLEKDSNGFLLTEKEKKFIAKFRKKLLAWEKKIMKEIQKLGRDFLNPPKIKLPLGGN